MNAVDNYYEILHRFGDTPSELRWRELSEELRQLIPALSENAKHGEAQTS